MIHVCDNFFEDPFEIREVALQSEYNCNTDNNTSWPGFRCSTIPESITDPILSAAQHYTKNPSLKLGVPSSFQYVTGDCKDGVFHTDGSALYTCMVYLSLYSPKNSGTEVCDSDLEDWDNIIPSDMTSIKREFYEDPKNLLKAKKFDRIKNKINSHFNPIAKIPNKFNRFILFPGNSFHRAQNYFGTSIEDARLILISFLST